MTKQDVVKRIRELAADRQGHVGFDVFVEETGIKDKWLRVQEWWTGWNSLLSEIGLETRTFSKAATPLEHVAEAVALLIERQGRWPTDDDLRRERSRDRSFPSATVVIRFRRSGALAKGIVALAEKSRNFAAASTIARAHLPSDEEILHNEDEKVKGYVYLLRSGRRYKIGKSTDPSRRCREVRLELPDETHQVHTIQTDDPTGIEKYWHQRFEAKQIRNTEFFELEASDVQAFKRRKYQ